jgi:hypothetical protein
VVWRSSCRSVMLRQEELAFIKALSTFQVSPAVLKELRTALSRKKKRPAVPAESRSTAPGGRAGAPNDHQNSSRASAKPTSWLARATHPSPQTGAQRRVRASACERIGSHGRTSCFMQPATRSARGWGDVRGCLSRNSRPVSAKWAAQAHSHGFGPVGTCFLT